MVRIELLTEQYIEQLRVWRNQTDIKSHFVYDGDISEQAQIRWFERYQEDQYDHMFVVFEDDNPIGAVGIHVEAIYNIVEFGRLMIGEKSARGKGYGTEITRQVCKYVFEDIDMGFIHLKVFSDNTRAIDAYEKVGFVKTTEITEERGREMNTMVLNKEYLK